MKNSEHSAFPLPKDRDENKFNLNGLSKREYFAAMAMNGVLSSGGAIQGFTEYTPNLVSKTAIAYADELLKQLES